VPEVLLTYTTPDDGGALLILGCADGRYVSDYRYSAGGSVPELTQIGDLNRDSRPEILFSTQVCDEDASCAYRTQMVTWRSDLGRFVSLFAQPPVSETLPTTGDVDNDTVQEVVVRQENPGNAETGPLRTGVTIYDWNGAVYVQSVTQNDPPRFRIQVIHDADRAFLALDAAQAIPLYQLALDSTSLEAWQIDETPALQAYTLYRLLVAYAYTEDARRLDAYQRLLQTFPDPATAPPYVELATAFWNALQVTNNLTSACREVQEILRNRPDALALLNRYGSRSPVYTAEVLCPF
jgi:hypothetical protein